MRKALLAAALLLCARFSLCAAPALPQAHGVFRLRYTHDKAEGVQEGRLSQFLRLDIKNFFWEKLAWNFEGRNDYRRKESPWGSGDSKEWQVFSAHAVLRDLPAASSLRVGRQYFLSADSAPNFDGLSIESAPAPWLSAEAFAGVPVAWRGRRLAEEMGGGGVKLGAGKKAYLQGTWLFASHRGAYPSDWDAQGSAFWRVSKGVNVLGRFAYLNGLPKNASARVQCQFFDQSMSVGPYYYRQMYAVDLASARLSPYARSFAYDRPFERLGLQASKFFAGGLNASGGAEIYRPGRRQRYFASLASSDLFAKGLGGAASSDYFVNGAQNGLSITGTLTYDPIPMLRVSAGTGLQESRAGYVDSRRTLSRSYFAQMLWRQGSFFDMTLSPSLMTSSETGGSFYRVEMSNRWKF